MRLAIIGCGSIGTRHLKNALSLGCECYVVETNAQRRRWVQEQYPTASVFGLLGGEEVVDAWMVCTPYDSHLWWAEEAVRRRLPLFVEKPLGSLDQIEDWRRLVEASEGLVTQVGYQCRFHVKARAMKALSPANAGLFACDIDMSKWPGKNYGPPILEASHDLDLALWMGAPSDEATYVHNTVVLGKSWAVYVHDGGETYRRRWEVSGDGFSCRAWFNSPAELGDEMYLAELKHFLDCVQSGRQTDVPLRDGLRVLEVCAQIEAMTRQTV